MGILCSATSQTVDQIQVPGHAAGIVMSRGCAASEPASPPATTWGSEAAAAAGGTQARRLAARPSLCSRGAGGSRGARRADLGECGLLAIGGENFASPGPDRGLPPRGQDPSGGSTPATLAAGTFRSPNACTGDSGRDAGGGTVCAGGGGVGKSGSADNNNYGNNSNNGSSQQTLAFPRVESLA